MAQENTVVLHGFWASPFARRVELALKLKGIPFEYVEEDLQNKSELLLKYNPVHKKVPALVHNSKSLAESFVILEYIDETWKNGPILLPEDPYKRAKTRFWAHFLNMLFECMYKTLTTQGEAQEKAIKEVCEKVEHLEEGMKEIFTDGVVSISKESMGLLDIIMCTLFGPHSIELEKTLGYTLLDPQRTPLVLSWVASLNKLDFVREAAPPKEKILEFLLSLREKALQSSTT